MHNLSPENYPNMSHIQTPVFSNMATGNGFASSYTSPTKNTSSNAVPTGTFGTISLADCLKSQQLMLRYAPDVYKPPKPSYSTCTMAYDSKFTPSTYVPASKTSNTNDQGKRPLSSLAYFNLDTLRRYHDISSLASEKFFSDGNVDNGGEENWDKTKKSGGKSSKARNSALADQQNTKEKHGHFNSTLRDVKPDSNNNFLKERLYRFLPEPRDAMGEFDVDMGRISRLAQPKTKKFDYNEEEGIVFERYPSYHRSPKRKATSETYMRLERLALPRRVPQKNRSWATGEDIYKTSPSVNCWQDCCCPCCTRNVCICPGGICGCLAFSQGYNDPRNVNWDRLATPKRKYPPCWKPIRTVEPKALKAVATRRVEKLAIPKKAIDCHDYYLWLWNKKPDTRNYLRKFKRLCIDKSDMEGTRVLLRCDLDFTFGSPLMDKVKDVVPSIKYALEKGAKSVVIISRCGTESGIRNREFSFRGLEKMFEEFVGTNVIYLDDCVGYQTITSCEDPEPGSVFLLENLVFHHEELGFKGKAGEEPEMLSTQEQIETFREKIFGLADIYVYDSFTELISTTNTSLAPPKQDFAYGLKIKKELEIFNRYLLHHWVTPLLAIIGGPFWSTWKIVRNVMGKVTNILLGGEVALMFLHVIKNVDIGDTECNNKIKKKVLRMYTRAKDTKTSIHLPSDHVVMDCCGQLYSVLSREDVDPWFSIVDIGPHTRHCYCQAIRQAKNIIWFGRMGDLPDGTACVTSAFVEVTERGDKTYVLDDETKILVNGFGEPKGAMHVTADGEVTTMLLNGSLPPVLAALSHARKKVKKRKSSTVMLSTKPKVYEIPGMQMVGGARQGVSYSASSTFMCINDLVIENKNVLIRVDFDSPPDDIVACNYRLRLTIPTIRYAQKWHAKAIVLLCHMTVPRQRTSGLKGDPQLRKEYSLKPICDELATLLGQTIVFVPDCVGSKVEGIIGKTYPGTVFMLENVQFHGEEVHGMSTREHLLAEVNEESPTPTDVANFCEKLSKLGDVYVNDGFACLYHDYCSITGFMLPNRVCGFLLKNELKYLARVFNYPRRKMMIILGGNRVKHKLNVLPGLFREADTVILTGLISLLFLRVAFNITLGQHKFSEEDLQAAERMIQLAEYYSCRLFYPVDLVVSESPHHGPSKQVSISDGIPENSYCVDIGSMSRSVIKRLVCKSHGLVFWIGCAGRVEIEEFAEGTKSILSAMELAHRDPENRRSEKVETLVAGKTVTKYLHQLAPDHAFITHVTTGGTTVLRLISERTALGLDSLRPKPGKKPLCIMSLEDVDISNKRVLIRCDLNMSVKDGAVEDLFPLQSLAETIQYCLDNEARSIVLIGHQGKPGGVRPTPPKEGENEKELSGSERVSSETLNAETEKNDMEEEEEDEKEEDERDAAEDTGVKDQEDDAGAIKQEWISEYSLMPVRDALSLILRKEIVFVDEGVSIAAEEASSSSEQIVVMLENTRYQPEEEGIFHHQCGLKIPSSYLDLDIFRKQLSSLGDVFVNESFGSLHHTHSSVVGILDMPKVAGPALKKQVVAYHSLRDNMQSPFLVIIGGDAEDSLDNILRLYKMLDYINAAIMCGHMAFLFLDHSKLGNLPVDQTALKMVPRVIKKAALNKVQLYFPKDYICIKDVDMDNLLTVKIAKKPLPENIEAFDIGPDTIANFKKIILGAKTIVLDGVAGSVEHPLFQKGTRDIINCIQEATNAGATSVALGVKTGVRLNQLDLTEAFEFYSTGVQAFFDIMAKKPVPGLQILDPMPPKTLQVLCIDQVSVLNKRVLIRLDLDVPTVEDVVLDIDKLEDTSTTILYCLQGGAKCVILMGHRGEPQGFKNVFLSLEPLVSEFQNILQREVTFIKRPCGDKATEMLRDPEPGSVFLFENLKFYPAETGQDATPRIHHHLPEAAEEAEAATPLAENAKGFTEKDSETGANNTESETAKSREVSQQESETDNEEKPESSSKTESDLTVSDGDGGIDIDSLLYQRMKPKSVGEYVRDLTLCGDIFVNDDVTDLEDQTLTSLAGFDVGEKACGFLLANYLLDSSSDDVYELRGVKALNPARKWTAVIPEGSDSRSER